MPEVLRVCPHVYAGQAPTRLFAHLGKVHAAFCGTCEGGDGSWDFADAYMVGWSAITEDQATRRGIPLTVECDDEAVVLGR